MLNVPATIVVPTSTPGFIIEKMRSHNAEVIVKGNVWFEAHQHALSLLTPDSELIHPFDHDDIREGHATMIHEIKAQLGGIKPKAIVCVVGGGGLLGGVLQGLDAVGWGDVRVYTGETEGAESFHLALQAKELVTLDDITSIAKTLGASTIAKTVLDLSLDHDVRSRVVSDKDAVRSIIKFSKDHMVLVEPSCAAGLSLIYDDLLDEDIEKDAPIVAIVCGGSIVNLEMLHQWKESFELQ